MSTQTATKKRRVSTGDILVNGALILMVVVWLIPTIGLLVSSFRTRFDIQTSGWWTIFPHKEWETTKTIVIPTDLDRNGVMTIEGAQGTFDEFRAGVVTGDDKQLVWIGNKRLGRIEVQEQKWAMNLDFTLENYQQVLGGKTFEVRNADGTTTTVQGDDFWGAFMNSLIVTVPATVIPILIAAFAAYAFAWMRFPGRRVFFIMVVALLVVPLQIALVPILKDYVKLDLNGTFLGIWLAHTGFGLSLAVYLLYNYISTLPREIMEFGLYRRRFPLHDLYPAGPAAVGAGPGLLRHLPVPVDLERLPGGLDLHRRQARRAGPDDAHRRDGRLARQRLAPAHRRRVRLDDRAVDRLLRPAALLRARHDGRLGEGLTGRYL